VKRLTHIDGRGEAKMVDVSQKPISHREATARGEVRVSAETLSLMESQQIAKGNVLATARIAGIQAAKRTGELIPLCHPLPITHCEVEFDIPASRDRIVITASARITAQTGVEMEALTAVSVAALTIYDMCKAVDKEMSISEVRLLRKTKSPAH
jgi:cyclic pyranopterin monophosphate synthase